MSRYLWCRRRESEWSQINWLNNECWNQAVILMLLITMQLSLERWGFNQIYESFNLHGLNYFQNLSSYWIEIGRSITFYLYNEKALKTIWPSRVVRMTKESKKSKDRRFRLFSSFLWCHKRNDFQNTKQWKWFVTRTENISKSSFLLLVQLFCKNSRFSRKDEKIGHCWSKLLSCPRADDDIVHCVENCSRIACC